MDVFALRERIVAEYAQYIGSFVTMRDDAIRQHVEAALEEGLLWPEPLLQLNPAFEPGRTVDQLVADGTLHPECARIFRRDKTPDDPGQPLRLHRHQDEAITVACAGHSYVLTTGTGSGKSLAYIVPAVDAVLREGSGKGVRAIVVYPMNALANSQEQELRKFLVHGYGEGHEPVRFARYTGQEKAQQKEAIRHHPPDILLTNYVMLELILTRPDELPLVDAAQGLRFLVLDELHTYRGRQAADVAVLLRRARDRLGSTKLQCVGTSATLAGPGTHRQQQQEVAAMATRLFGQGVQPDHVIGETLRRVTREADPNDPAFVAHLRARLQAGRAGLPTDGASFAADPLSSWIESVFGLTREPGGERLVRARPRPLGGPDGAARELAELTSLDAEHCLSAIQDQLMTGYEVAHDPDLGHPLFAFRLHQFISRGDAVYATVEPEDQRYITLQGQQFVPGDRSRVLLPLVFCRECGQEYYCVERRAEPGQPAQYLPRRLSERGAAVAGDAGFLYLSTTQPWSDDQELMINEGRVPEDWLEEHRGGLRVRRERRAWLPQLWLVAPDATESGAGALCAFLGAPFRFCPHCGVSYDQYQSSDFGKLAALSTEGRSSAVTILGLSAVAALRRDPTVQAHARKLLSFTDNRQDAALQAGHLNDFVQTVVMRAAVYRAVEHAGTGGLRHDHLAEQVAAALNLHFGSYAKNPEARFAAREDTESALRQVLGYRVYRDLQYGWRVNAPNLEQCGLLRIDYRSLDELCAASDADLWSACHPALAAAATVVRCRIAGTLLNHLRRELAIEVDYLRQSDQDRLRQLSSQHLAGLWALDRDEEFVRARTAFPRPQREHDLRDNVYLGPRGGFGRYLRRPGTFPESGGVLAATDVAQIVVDLFGLLTKAGILLQVQEPRDEADVPGYRLQAAALVWRADDGTTGLHDPLRTPSAPSGGPHTNPFFVNLYREIAAGYHDVEAQPHTAQVPPADRQEREERFGRGDLEILYCSPTMELGVDIRGLNVVNLRNVPPTPANYVQRSGRAGRSGQPALVFTYCSTYSSHDQYFFRRRELMVAGKVSTPVMDLANEDLLRSHLHAIWLEEARQGLGQTLLDVLDLNSPELPLLPSVQEALRQEAPRSRALSRAGALLQSLAAELQPADWYVEGWLEEAILRLPERLNQACERWRELYRSAVRQRDHYHEVLCRPGLTPADHRRAERLRAEAEDQLRLLTQSDRLYEADFYSYRYLASEGFLPGYSFPRLPLSACVQRRKDDSRHEYITRPRFLALSEFGPGNLIYHEGARFRVNRVLFPAGREQAATGISTESAKRCAQCGYLSPVTAGHNPDVCARPGCGASLGQARTNHFRLPGVMTSRTQRISCAEEERVRLGYDVHTAVRLADRGDGPVLRTAEIHVGAQILARLTYGPAATLWRINYGWRRRQGPDGFLLNPLTGYWLRDSAVADVSDDLDDDPTAHPVRVIPFVEDHRNVLLFEPQWEADDADAGALMASLEASLNRAIRTVYQLEEGELASEPLPSSDDRRLLLFFEAAEGGAGALRMLLDRPGDLAQVARAALDTCHFDPVTGADRRRAEGATEDCEAACYDCLMSYRNQQDHRLLDRLLVRDWLLQLARAQVVASPTARPRAEHLADLRQHCGSDLERQWLGWLEGRQGSRLPSRSQVLIEECSTRPDFVYDEQLIAVYIDGPPHDYPERQQRDATQTAALEDHGWVVVRFPYFDHWDPLGDGRPDPFGSKP